jgi:cytoskeletal protein CcmA (bactofilin family)
LLPRWLYNSWAAGPILWRTAGRQSPQNGWKSAGQIRLSLSDRCESALLVRQSRARAWWLTRQHDEGSDCMIFNKKPDEVGGQAFAPARTSINTPAAEQVPLAQRRPGTAAPSRAIIDAHLNIDGNLTTEGEVQVDGKINGNIRCAHLTVGRDAVILGDITAEEIVVRGKVTGIIRGNRVILQDGAQVESEIFQTKLTIEEGANFKGMIRDQDEPAVGALKDMAAEMKAKAAPAVVDVAKKALAG